VHGTSTTMVSTTIFDSIKVAPCSADACKDEDEKDASLSSSADLTSISLSNQGIETIDLDRCIGSKKSQSQQFQSRIPQAAPLTGFPQVSTIVRLDLSRNKLTSLPKELFGENKTGSLSFPMLEYLDVGRNKLKGLPPEIGNCKHLKTIIALSNNLRPSGFPLDAIASLPLVEILDLRWNKKMNSQSSRRRLTEVFLDGGDQIQPKKVELLLSPTTKENTNSDENSKVTTKKKLSACDRDANELRSQLEPLSTPQLRKRLHRTFDIRFDDDGDEGAYDRDNIMQQLLRCYGSRDNSDKNGHPIPVRTVRYEHGVPLDPTLLKELLDEMELIRWPRTTRERPKILAQGYIILQRPPPSTPATICDHETPTKANNNKAKREAEKLERFSGIWNKALRAIESVDKEFARQFTALAVTKNFKGSPHIDTLNIAPFYGLSLGGFANGGGKLCVECSATCVAEIDTRGKFAKVDGRFCHWVSDYEGTRYSLIYYVTHGKVVPQTTAIFKPPCIDAAGNEEERKNYRQIDWDPPPVFVP